MHSVRGNHKFSSGDVLFTGKEGIDSVLSKILVDFCFFIKSFLLTAAEVLSAEGGADTADGRRGLVEQGELVVVEEEATWLT